MKIFIDSADIAHIEEAFSWGIVDGVTTNPSLIKKAVEQLKSTGESLSMSDYIRRILETAGDAPVSLEVIGTTEREMTAQGHFLYETFNKVANNVVVKIPVNPNATLGGPLRFDGLKAIRTLSQDGIPINTTLIFTPEQAMCAAKAGAAFVSPFAGRIDDFLRKKGSITASKDAYFPREGMRDEQHRLLEDDEGIISGVHLVEEIVELFQVHDFDCQVLAASLRNARQVRECAIVGADVATLPFEVIREMLEHPKSVEGMIAFTNDIVPEYRDLLPKA